MSNQLRTAAITMLVVGMIVALSTASFAQKASLPKYDLSTETTLKGVTVQETKDVTLPNGQHRIRLIVKSGDELIEVCLCPKAFLEMMDAEFAKDDHIDVTGSKVKEDDKTIILAREIVKGQNTVVLRDKKGEPAWTWMEKTKTSEGK